MRALWIVLQVFPVGRHGALGRGPFPGGLFGFKLLDQQGINCADLNQALVSLELAHRRLGARRHLAGWRADFVAQAI